MIKLRLGINRKSSLILGAIVIFVITLSLGAAGGYFLTKNNLQKNLVFQSQAEKNIYIEFLSEIYDKIKANYWESLTDEQLGGLFKLGIEKLTGKPADFKIKTKDDFKNMLTETMKIVKEDKNKEFATQLANLILINLKPAGRSALYSMQDRENLSNRVENINPETDLYETIGIEKNASPEKLEEAYKSKISETDSQTELEQVKYAYEVLSDSAQKQKYDKTGIEPTVFASLIRPDILHLYIKKISPTTFDELKQKTEKFDNITGLNAMILDLRANVGGSVDILPYLLGPFIGNDQYAYSFFHQGEKTPFKTKLGWLPSLVRYKKLVILIDDKTQSSAEIMASTLKKYNIGVLVGTETKGWGTIESVINIDQQIDEQEKYAIFLVHSLTLNEDGQPIEGQGVSPTIQINDSDWKNQLFAYFHYDEFAKAVEEIWNK